MIKTKIVVEIFSDNESPLFNKKTLEKDIKNTFDSWEEVYKHFNVNLNYTVTHE